MLEVAIERLTGSGEGVAYHEGRALFIAGVASGETVRVEVPGDARTLRGVLVDVVAGSPDRRVPPCPLASACGGCDWMHLSEAAQLREKEAIIASSLAHVGRLAPGSYRLLPAVASPKALGARRRATLHPVAGRLGFHGRRSHTVVPVSLCVALSQPLQPQPGLLADALGSILKDCETVSLLDAGGRVAIAVKLKGEVRPRHREAVSAALRSGELSGAVIQPGTGQRRAELLGDAVLEEDEVLLRPDAFSQANAEVNRALVAAAVGQLQLSGAESVLELYSGNGNFTFPVARRAASVVAVESAPISLALAQDAARKRGTRGVRFVQGAAAAVAEGFAREARRFDRLLVDPPRIGARGVGRWAAALAVERVVYVGCDPVSLARDTAELGECGFHPDEVQAFDLFPQTHHVEALMSFRRGKA